MAANSFTCGIVVPVRDEERTLSQTVPALLATAKGENARIVWVCNGCRDGSARVIRQLAGPAAEVIEITMPGKTLALQAGDEALDTQDLFPRMYLDADTVLRPGDLGRLLHPLRTGQADLVAATHAFDLSEASSVSAAIARCWLALPFARGAAVLGAVCISRSGRAHWEGWPRITADDLFMSATVPSDRQNMVADALATTRPPSSFSGWVRMRARWLRGERELRALGLHPPAAAGQRWHLLSRLFRLHTFPGAFAFCLARLLAVPLAWCQADVSWRPDRRARNEGVPRVLQRGRIA
jgi:cellulose synthase/poly-beta-1,6-N-acetylglucosamine synthase-like glycosyltransferase